MSFDLEVSRGYLQGEWSRFDPRDACLLLARACDEIERLRADERRAHAQSIKQNELRTKAERERDEALALLGRIQASDYAIEDGQLIADVDALLEKHR